MDIGELIRSILSAPLVCISWIIVGIVAGALARRLMQSKDAPLISDFILGILGAIVGGFIGGWLGIYRVSEGGITLVVINLVVATLGAALLIWISRLFKGGGGKRRKR